MNYNQVVIQEFLQQELATCHGSGRLVVLDLGCGQAPYGPLYRPFAGCAIRLDVTASDATSAIGSACAIPLADASVDVIVFSEVIEHVCEPRAALREVARVLRPRGLLLITWPFLYPLHDFSEDYCRFTEFWMMDALERQGFQVERALRRGGTLALLSTIAEFIADGACSFWGKIPVLGFVARPLSWIVRRLFRFWHSALHVLDGERRLTDSPEADLRGWKGAGSRWTLGYCARARKRVG